MERVWKFNGEIRDKRQKTKALVVSRSSLGKTIHKTIKKVTEDIENLQYNTAISALMVLLNKFEEDGAEVGKEDIKIFLKLLAPFAPHITEELWSRFFASKKTRILDPRSESGQQFHSIHQEKWPVYDPQLIKEYTFELVIQINGKVRGLVKMPVGASEEEAKKAALRLENVKKYLTAEPRKVIFVPNKLINFVI